MAHTFVFQQQSTLKERKDKAARILTKYPDRVPVICEKDPKAKLVEMDKSKILVPRDLTVAQFIHVIRQRIKLEPSQTIFLFVNNKLIPTGVAISQVYETHKDVDGFLYVSYSSENYFG